MSSKIMITEYLDLDLDEAKWQCSSCGHVLIEAEKNYKEGCLVYGRDPREVHNPGFEGEFNFAPDPEWVKIVEFYCPACGVQIETEYLPLGHPITHDIEIDLKSLKERIAKGELAIVDKRLEVRS